MGLVTVFEKNGVKAYMPDSIDQYHTSRMVELNNQMLYATNGTTKDVLKAHLDKMQEYLDSDKPIASFRTDMSTLVKSLQYRQQYPVDELASLRIGMVLCFLDGEPENDYNVSWTRKKEKLAHDDSDWYSFFLTTGIEYQPNYTDYLTILGKEDYFQRRQEMLTTLEVSKSR